jgi:DNA repair exonuclease SbcCD ATPase subunit
MTQKVQDLSAALSQRKKARDVQADEARKALDTALASFDKEIKAAAQKNKGESPLSRYLASAQRIQNTIRKLNDELTARNMATYDRLNSLKGNLAQANNARIREAWANDPDLKNLERELAMKERRRNAAAATPALKAEAAKLQDDIDRINTEIEARRDLLVTADGQAGHIKAIEQILDETLKQMQTSQQKDDQMMRDLLAELSHEAPQLEGLPAEQKAQAEQLEHRSEELNKARAAYTAAMTAATAQADEQIGQAERELTQVQARLDARRNQLVQAASGVLSPEQVRARRLSAEQKRQELAAAKQAEAEARAAYVASQQKLLAAESEAKAVVAQRDGYQNNVNRLSELRGRQQRMKAELDGLEKAAANAIIPKPPGDDAVTVVREPDRLRWGLTFVLGTVAVALGCFMLFANLRAGSQVRLARSRPENQSGVESGATTHLEEPVAV